MTERCYACDRRVNRPTLADTRDGQTVYVGSECFKLIKRSGDTGWQPPKGGPRLYLIPKGLSQSQIDNLYRTSTRSNQP